MAQLRKIGVIWGKDIIVPQTTISIGIGIFGGLALIVIALTAAELLAPKYEKAIEFFALAVTAAGGVGGAFYLGQQLRMQYEHDREAAAFNLMARWNSPDMFNSRAACYQALETFQSEGADAVAALLAKNKDMALNARHILNFLEEVAIALNVGHVDEELTSRAFLTLVTRTYKAMEAWIGQHRRIAGTDRIWEELETLYKDWAKR